LEHELLVLKEDRDKLAENALSASRHQESILNSQSEAKQSLEQTVVALENDMKTVCGERDRLVKELELMAESHQTVTNLKAEMEDELLRKNRDLEKSLR
jgi:hypothetical protein